MSWVAAIVATWCVAMIVGKELEAWGWRSKSRVLFRKASGGRLFQVLDVTPWDDTTLQARYCIEEFHACQDEVARLKGEK